MLAFDQQRAAMNAARWPLKLRNPCLSKLARKGEITKLHY